MLREVIYWVSIVLMWVAMGLNVAGTIRNVRLSKGLDKLREQYEEEIEEFYKENARLRKARISDE